MNSKERNIVIALFVTTFLAAIEGTIVSTAMPAITNELNGMNLYSWVNSIYLLCMAISATLYGKLSDVYGRKPLIIMGTLIFTLGSTLSGLAWDMVSLIIFRAIQGLGGAALMSLPMIIIADLFDLERRAKLSGLLSSVWGVAGILGPLTGGLLVDHLSWRAVFYINVPFAVIAILLLTLYLPVQKHSVKLKIDSKGITLFSLAMLLFMYSISEISAAFNKSLSSGIALCGLLVLSFVLLILFYRQEHKVSEPFIAPALLKNKMLMFTIIVGFVISAINIAVLFYIPLWIQEMQGHSATISGLVMIPLSITWPLSSVYAGYALPRVGIFKINLFGCIALLMSGLGLALITPSTSHWLIMLYIAIAGWGYGMILTVGSILSSTVTSIQERGTAMSLVQVSRTLGQTIGLTIWGLFIFSDQLNPLYKLKLAHSLHLVFVLISILSLVIVCYIVYSLYRYNEHEQSLFNTQIKREKQVNG